MLIKLLTLITMFWYVGFCLLNRSQPCLFRIPALHSDSNTPLSENQSCSHLNHKVKMESKSRENLKSLLPMVDRIELASMKL